MTLPTTATVVPSRLYPVSEHAVYFRPAPGVPGVEALQAQFVEHAYMPHSHSHSTWTVAVVHHGAAQFDVDATHQRADSGELFVLEPEAVHTGMAAVPEGWAYKVVYLDPELINAWDERDDRAPRTARWVVFRDRAQMGLTPHAFQTNLRIARARALLSAGQPPAAVAATCGFADQAHLTRTFKRAVGVTPGRFATG